MKVREPIESWCVQCLWIGGEGRGCFRFSQRRGGGVEGGEDTAEANLSVSHGPPLRVLAPHRPISDALGVAVPGRWVMVRRALRRGSDQRATAPLGGLG